MFYYSLIGLLALASLIISNHDLLRVRIDKSCPPVQRAYVCFLLFVIAYYVSDILWGLLDVLRMTQALYVDTIVYFLAMAGGILYWTRYVIEYLEDKNVFRNILRYAGIVFFAAVAVSLAVNFFTPFMFWFDKNGAYCTGLLRHIILLGQILLFLVTSVYALAMSARTKDSVKTRHRIIGLFGLIMATVLSIQLFFPLLPLYAIGYMLGCGLLRTFVSDSEKKEYQRDLEAALLREQKQLKELLSTWELAYTDALTGVRSKLAYSEAEVRMNNAISEGKAKPFSVPVFDLNDLKQINDTMGHDAGDKAIIQAAGWICQIFRRSPVFRIGGDEFASILEGADFAEREELLGRFLDKMAENCESGDLVVSAGMSDFEPETDFNFECVFQRADSEMYSTKQELKGKASC